jgi:hypothetical protein
LLLNPEQKGEEIAVPTSGRISDSDPVPNLVRFASHASVESDYDEQNNCLTACTQSSSAAAVVTAVASTAAAAAMPLLLAALNVR